MLNALPRGAFKAGGSADGYATTEGAEGSEQLDAEGNSAERGPSAVASGWTPTLREAWQSHVASATRSQVR